MLIPNAENAAVDIRKLRNYCLNLEHDEGKHKARLFSSVFGMTVDNAERMSDPSKMSCCRSVPPRRARHGATAQVLHLTNSR
ncbi:MAG: hypothetical protein F6K28_37865 [Microcoleus sp. SIO2G3]|nr:hypothetical protein [Microcoleus sp. SIO2G3]